MPNLSFFGHNPFGPGNARSPGPHGGAAPGGAPSGPGPGGGAAPSVPKGLPVVPAWVYDRSQIPEGELPLLEAEASTAQELYYRSSYSGPVLTAPGSGGPLISDEARAVLALVDEGVLLVARQHRTDTVVWSFYERLLRSGLAPYLFLYVDVTVLQAVYHAAAARTRDLGIADPQSSSAARERFMTYLRRCVADKASDLHVDLDRNIGYVRYRVGQRIRSLGEPLSGSLCDEMLNVAFMLCDDTDGSVLRRNAFQRGRISGQKLSLPEGMQAARLQFGDLAGRGQFMVMRFFYTSSLSCSDESELGYADFQVSQLRKVRLLASGLNLIAGVTGSGKSTTLQVVLSSLASENDNSLMIITVEDPPEYVIENVRQLPVVGSDEQREKALYAAISAALRSDPDVIMIGEVRDRATADLVVRAAQTGQQVWTTIHATRAVRAIARLIDEGVSAQQALDPDVVTGLIGQRLVPKLCPYCSLSWEEAKARTRHPAVFFHDVETRYFPGRLDLLQQHMRIHSSRDIGFCTDVEGCDEGYLRYPTVVAEVCMPDEAYMQRYRDGLPRDAERHWISHLKGVRIAEHGIVKALLGQLDLYDVNRAVGIADFSPDRLEQVVQLHHRMTSIEAAARVRLDPGASIDDDPLASVLAVDDDLP